MSSIYPPCLYTLLYLAGIGGGVGSGEGEAPFKIMDEIRGLDDSQTYVVLLIFNVIESLKIINGPLTIVRDQNGAITLILEATMHT